MQKKIHKIIFLILKSFVLFKKTIFLFFNFIRNLSKGLDETYKRTLGFKIYKILFLIKRKFSQLFLFIKKQSKLEIFGSRTLLQFFILLIVFIIIIPQTKIIKKNRLNNYGRDSLLFQILGPGSQDFTLEEVSLDLKNIEIKQATDSWKVGVISYNNENNTNNELEEITGLSMGGTVIKKPIIINSVEFSDYSQKIIEKKSTGRTKKIEYEVQSGDVIGKIAQRFNIDINTILWANNLTLNSYIRPGDIIDILPVSGITHIVSNGDTVSKIARLYGADIKKIIEYNDLLNNGANIKIGQNLIIPDGKKVQVSYSRPSSFNTVAAKPTSANIPAGTGYLWPTSGNVITQYFGWRHGGLDIGGPVGIPLYATKAGKVLKSQCGWNWGYGCYVHIDHGNGVQSIYAHASVLYVSAGDYVSQGQNIAAMGSTGNSTGPHIHFEIRVNGVRQNPLAYIRK